MTTVQQIIETITHDSLYTYKPKNSAASLPARTSARTADRNNKKGAIAVVRTKDDLSCVQGVKGYVVTSRETLTRDAPQISHWTPNPFNFLEYSDDKRQYIKGHTESNLQQINVFIVDIDSKEQPYNEILTTALEHSIGVPTLVLETPKGYQAYFVLDSPLYISNRNDFRGLKVAKRISQNIRRSLAGVLTGVDVTCNDFGFFRMPTDKNVRWFNCDMLYRLHDLIAWSKRQDDDQERGLFVTQTNNNGNAQDASEWLTGLLSARHVKGESGQIGRDNLMYTVALACYSSGRGEGETLDLLDEYNSSLDTPVRHSQVRKIVRSAYKGKFKGPSQAYVCELVDAWCPGVEVTSNTGGWYKHKKARVDRVRSHYDEWEADVLSYIESETTTAEPIVWSTQRALCERIGIPRSTFNELIRDSKQILVRREGRGRGARTGLTSVAVMLRCAIDYNQTHRSAYYDAVRMLSVECDNKEALRELETQVQLLTWKPPRTTQKSGSS